MMKKSLLALSFAAALLAGCTNNQPAEQVDAGGIPNAIPMGMDSGIQSTEMPAGMSGGVVPPVPAYTPPVYQQPTYQAPSQPQSVSYQQPTQSHAAGSCQVVRDASGAPAYAQMQKGCYSDATYTVGKGDTMFLIAFLTGKTPAEIAALNQMSQPYQLKVGQTLQVR